MATRGLIFDFDGTLAVLTIDFAAMAAEVRALAAELGFAGPWPGRGYLLEQAEEVARALGDGFLARAHALIEARELAAARAGRLFAFTPGLLATARARGYALAVVSRNCGAAIATVFPGVRAAVDAFLPREAAPRPKPHPEHLGLALKMLGLAPERAVMVGDHPSDVAAGQAVGCRTVGVLSGRTGREEMQKAGADLILPDAGGLLDALAEG